MEIFYAILCADKSWPYIVNENGMKFLMPISLAFAGRRKI